MGVERRAADPLPSAELHPLTDSHTNPQDEKTKKEKNDLLLPTLFVDLSRPVFDWVHTDLVTPLYQLLAELQKEEVRLLLLEDGGGGAPAAETALASTAKGPTTGEPGEEEVVVDSAKKESRAVPSRADDGIQLEVAPIVSDDREELSKLVSYRIVDIGISRKESAAATLFPFSQVLELISDVVLMGKWQIMIGDFVAPLVGSNTWYKASVPFSKRAHSISSALRTACVSIPNGERISWVVSRPEGESKTVTSTPSAGRQIVETLGAIRFDVETSLRLRAVFSEDVWDVYSGVFTFLLTLCYAQRVLQDRWSEVSTLTRQLAGEIAKNRQRGNAPPPTAAAASTSSTRAADPKWKQYSLEDELTRHRSEAVVNHMLLFVIDAVLSYYLHESHSLFAEFRRDVLTGKKMETVGELLRRHEMLLVDLQHLSLSSQSTQHLWRNLSVLLSLAIDPSSQQDRRERPDYATQRVKVAVGGLVEALSAASSGEPKGGRQSEDEQQEEEADYLSARKTLPLLRVLTMNRFFSDLGTASTRSKVK